MLACMRARLLGALGDIARAATVLEEVRDEPSPMSP